MKRAGVASHRNPPTNSPAPQTRLMKSRNPFDPRKLKIRKPQNTIEPPQRADPVELARNFLSASPIHGTLRFASPSGIKVNVAHAEYNQETGGLMVHASSQKGGRNVWAYYPQSNHLRAFFDGAKYLDPGGVAQEFPSAVGAIDTLVHNNRELDILSMQSGYRESTLPPEVLKTYKSWRGNLLQMLFRHAEANGISEVRLFHPEIIKNETNPVVFKRVAKARGFTDITEENMEGLIVTARKPKQ